MSLASTGAHAGDLARRIDRRPYESLRRFEDWWFPVGLNSRGVSASAAGFWSDSFVVALAVGLWTWGTWWGWGFFAFAFITQVTSATDVLRQGSFPIYPSRTALFFVSSALALVFYLPTLFVLSEIARPGFEPDGTGSGFLVNCWAYHGDSKPHEGQWIWMKLPPLGEQRAGRVIAVSGQEVEWTGRRGALMGMNVMLHSSLRPAAMASVCRFKVPSDQVLVEPDDEGATTLRAWARSCSCRPIGSSAVRGLISIRSGIAICSKVISSRHVSPSHRRGHPMLRPAWSSCGSYTCGMP